MDAGSERFIERMGQFYQAEAGPRIAGRLFALLLLSAEPLSLDEIAERLQVSKASASGNARLLERLRVVERVTKPGDRRDYYEVTQESHERMVEERLQRLTRLWNLLGEGLETGAAEDPAVRDRLVLFQHSFGMLIEAMREIRERTAVGERSQEAI